MGRELTNERLKLAASAMAALASAIIITAIIAPVVASATQITLEEHQRWSLAFVFFGAAFSSAMLYYSAYRTLGAWVVE